MKSRQISWKLFSTLVVVTVALTVGLELYWDEHMGCTGPCPPNLIQERMAFNSVQVNSPTNATVSLSNAGSEVISLTAYYVKDSAGDKYSNSTWAGPTVVPSATASVNILLAGSLTGQPFQFRSGQTY